MFLLQISTSEGLEIADNAFGVSVLYSPEVVPCSYYPWLLVIRSLYHKFGAISQQVFFYSNMRGHEHTSDKRVPTTVVVGLPYECKKVKDNLETNSVEHTTLAIQ
jgi:hypothetical protein